MLRPVIALPMLAVLILAGCAEPNASGVFVATYPEGGGAMMQLTAQEDGSVAGALSEITLTTSGAVQSVTFPVVGTTADESLTLAVKPNASEPPTLTLTGTLDGDELSLSDFAAGQLSTRKFHRTQVQEFAKVADKVRSRAEAIKTAQFQAEQTAKAIEARGRAQADIDEFSRQVVAASEQFDRDRRTMDSSAGFYVSVARRNGELRMMRQQFVSKGRADTAERIEEAIARNEESAANRHDEMLRLMSDVSRRRGNANMRASELNALCDADRTLRCDRMRSALKLYFDKAAAVERTAVTQASAFQKHIRG